jgi:alpha-glucosidase
VLMNLNHEPLEMPAGQVLVRSTSSESEGLLASGETAWIRITSAG